MLFLILIIAAFFRLYNIQSVPPGLYPDEAMNGNNALEALSTGQFKIFYPENNGREGLFINIQAISVLIFGNVSWALRLVSSLFGIATVLGMYFLVRELFLPPNGSHQYEELEHHIKRHERIALLASFLLATSFWHVNFSRIGFRAISSPFYAIWGVFFTLLAIRKLKEFKARQAAASAPIAFGAPSVFAVPKEKTHWHLNTDTILATLAGGFIFGLGINSYIAYRIMPVLIVCMFLYWFAWFKSFRKELLRVCVLFIGAALLGALPLLWHFAFNPHDFFGRTSQVSVFAAAHPMADLVVNVVKTIGMFNIQGDGNWRHNLADRPELFWPAGVMFIIGILAAIKVSMRFLIGLFKRTAFQEQPAESTVGTTLEDAHPLALLIPMVWFLITLLPVVISDEGIPHALRSILLIPPVFIFAGAGGIWLADKIGNAIKGDDKSAIRVGICRTLIVFMLALMVGEAYNTYFYTWARNPNVFGAFTQSYVDLGNEINALPQDEPKYIIVKAGGTPVRGIPMPTQTVMFITDSFTPIKQQEKNIHYILPGHESDIPPGAYTATIE